MTNNSACWYLLSGAKAALASQSTALFSGPAAMATDTQGLGIDVYNLLGFRFVYFYASEIHITALFDVFPAHRRIQYMANPDPGRGGAWHVLSLVWFGFSQGCLIGVML